MGPSSTNADDTDLLDARQKSGGEEKTSDSISVPILRDYGGGTFQQPSCHLEATANRSNTDELHDSTSKAHSGHSWANPVYEECTYVWSDWTDIRSVSGLLPLFDGPDDLRHLVTGYRTWAETMDEVDGDYPLQLHYVCPTRHLSERGVEANPESLRMVNIMGKNGNVAAFRAYFSPHQGRSYVEEKVLRRFDIKHETVTDQVRRCETGDSEGNRWQGQRNKDRWEAIRYFASACRGGLSHAPLAIAFGGAYYMGKWRLDPAGRDVFGHQHLPDGGGLVDHTLDTFKAISPPVLFAAIATTSFSLTAYHYILMERGRDRDLVLLGLIGAGTLAGSLAGLDGVEIVFRVVPWCAIAAFVLCAFVIPPRARNPMILEAGGGTEELPKAALDTLVVAEKEAMMDIGGAGGLELAVGLEE